jgi:hypothetical protein
VPSGERERKREATMMPFQGMSPGHIFIAWLLVAIINIPTPVGAVGYEAITCEEGGEPGVRVLLSDEASLSAISA